MSAAVNVDKIRTQYTAPYYMSMNRLTEPQLTQFAALARQASVDEVLWMLSTEEWRSRRMGAWFALFHQVPEVRAALRASLLTSRGEFTAPELTVALVVVDRASALAALREYQAIATRDHLGGTEWLSAVISSLELARPDALPRGEVHPKVDPILAVAGRLLNSVTA